MLNSLQWRQHKHKAREARVVRVPREEKAAEDFGILRSGSATHLRPGPCPFHGLKPNCKYTREPLPEPRFMSKSEPVPSS